MQVCMGDMWLSEQTKAIYYKQLSSQTIRLANAV